MRIAFIKAHPSIAAHLCALRDYRRIHSNRLRHGVNALISIMLNAHSKAGRWTSPGYFHLSANDKVRRGDHKPRKRHRVQPSEPVAGSPLPRPAGSVPSAPKGRNTPAQGKSRPTGGTSPWVKRPVRPTSPEGAEQNQERSPPPRIAPFWPDRVNEYLCLALSELASFWCRLTQGDARLEARLPWAGVSWPFRPPGCPSR